MGYSPCGRYCDSNPNVTNLHEPSLVLNKYGGEGGIRTHVGLHPNGFQDRPVMTASVPLQKVNLISVTNQILP